MISVNDFRTGTTIELEDAAWQVLEFQHVKPGKGAAFVRSKLRNIKTGAIQDRTFRGGEKVAPAHIDTVAMQYLYNNNSQYTFMNTNTYEQTNINADRLKDQLPFLVENMEVQIVFHKGEIIGIQLPNSVTLEVIETEPSTKGDTATGATKTAKLSTDLEVQVPLFINLGDKLVIDTRNSKYVSRA